MECWLINDRDRHAQVTVEDSPWWAHRYAWYWAHGPIPVGLVIHHRCFQRACVNPDHLQALTRSEHARLHRLGGDTSHLKTPPTHCKHGHSLADAKIIRGHHRDCRTCSRVRNRAYRNRLAARVEIVVMAA